MPPAPIADDIGLSLVEPLLAQLSALSAVRRVGLGTVALDANRSSVAQGVAGAGHVSIVTCWSARLN